MIAALILSATLATSPLPPVRQPEQLVGLTDATAQCLTELERKSISRAKEACTIAMLWATVDEDSTEQQRTALINAVHFVSVKKDVLPQIGWTK